MDLEQLKCPECEATDLWASGVRHSNRRLYVESDTKVVVGSKETETNGPLLIDAVVCHSCKKEWRSVTAIWRVVKDIVESGTQKVLAGIGELEVK